jgi:hypothetical protein
VAITVDAAQNAGGFGDAATSATVAFPNNLTNGRMIVMVGVVWNNGSAFGPFANSNCTKSAGTSTVGTITLAQQRQRTTSGAFVINVGIWSALVTGAGSCTMQIATFPAGSFSWIAVMEMSTDVGWDASRLEDTASADGTSLTPNSTNCTSVDDAVFVGGFIGNFPTNSAITPDVAYTTCFESENGVAHEPGSAIYRVVTSNTSSAANWTVAVSDQWAAAQAVFRETITPAADPSVAWITA